jgi:hypothetical protein
VTYEIRLRGNGPRYVIRVADGAAEVRAAGGPVDCVISADPATYPLVSYGRMPLGRALLRGGILAWGRRPWLSLRFRTCSSIHDAVSGRCRIVFLCPFSSLNDDRQTAARKATAAARRAGNLPESSPCRSRKSFRPHHWRKPTLRRSAARNGRLRRPQGAPHL